MKKQKSSLITLTNETPEARKKRVSSGVRLRAAVVESKKRKLKEKAITQEEYDL